MMGPFDKSTKRRPTREQEELLARISNPQQRRTLIRAIENGEDIPSYAWTPLTEEEMRKIVTAFGDIRQKAEDARRRCQKEGTTFDELVEFDPEGSAEAVHDENRLMELIASMKAARGGRPKPEPVPTRMERLDEHVEEAATAARERQKNNLIFDLFYKTSKGIWKMADRVQQLALAVMGLRRKNALAALAVVVYFPFGFAAGAGAFLLAAILQTVLTLVFLVLASIHGLMSVVVAVVGDVFSRNRQPRPEP